MDSDIAEDTSFLDTPDLRRKLFSFLERSPTVQFGSCSRMKRFDERLQIVRAILEAMMNDHGLSSWSFNYNNSTSKSVSCDHHKLIMAVSMPWVCSNDGESYKVSYETIRQRFLHFLCHMVLYKEAVQKQKGGQHKVYSHTNEWRQMIQRLGGSTEYEANCRACDLKILPTEMEPRAQGYLDF